MVAIAFLVGGLADRQGDGRAAACPARSRQRWSSGRRSAASSDRSSGTSCRIGGAAARPDRHDLLGLRAIVWYGGLIGGTLGGHVGRSRHHGCPGCSTVDCVGTGAGARPRHRPHRLPAGRRRRLGNGHRRAVGDGLSATPSSVGRIRRAMRRPSDADVRDARVLRGLRASSGRCASARIPTARSSGGTWCSARARASSIEFFRINPTVRARPQHGAVVQSAADRRRRMAPVGRARHGAGQQIGRSRSRRVDEPLARAGRAAARRARRGRRPAVHAARAAHRLPGGRLHPARPAAASRIGCPSCAARSCS